MGRETDWVKVGVKERHLAWWWLLLLPQMFNGLWSQTGRTHVRGRRGAGLFHCHRVKALFHRNPGLPKRYCDGAEPAAGIVFPVYLSLVMLFLMHRQLNSLLTVYGRSPPQNHAHGIEPVERFSLRAYFVIVAFIMTSCVIKNQVTLLVMTWFTFTFLTVLKDAFVRIIENSHWNSSPAWTDRRPCTLLTSQFLVCVPVVAFLSAQ